jgi:hypothetical protein
LTIVRTVDPYWGERHNSYADFNPNHKQVNAAPKKATDHFTSTPPCNAPTSKVNVCKMHSSQYKSGIKKSKRVELATKTKNIHMRDRQANSEI